MPFVTEEVSAEDRIRFGLGKMVERFVVGFKPISDWAIDRERNIYLLQVARGRFENFYKSTWVLYFDRDIVVIEIENMGSQDRPDGVRVSQRKLLGAVVPERLRARRAEMIAVLKEAFSSYKDTGVRSSDNEYLLDFVIQEGAL